MGVGDLNMRGSAVANKTRHLTPDSMKSMGRWPATPEESAKREFARILIEELAKRFEEHY